MARSRNSRKGIRHRNGHHTPYEGCEHCSATARPTKKDVANNARRLREQGSIVSGLADYEKW